MLTFEQEFTEKCKDSDSLGLLRSQWDVDKEWLTHALSAVPLFYPHFSRHDSSHATTLLANIGRIVGPERTKKLSATNLWLLLEAAFWHDVGMVIDAPQARIWWCSEEFRAHCRNLEGGNDEVLARAAAVLRDRKSLVDLDDTWPLQVRQYSTFLLADFARTKHASRSESIVCTPQLIGIDAPRGLIPDRLFRHLGQIAHCHGQNREQLMNLPHVEQGVGLDDCHPRLIASLLRLGDLLDLDNGRFCPILSSTLSLLPATSEHHVQKHASIRKLLITPERIDVEAICNDLHHKDLKHPSASDLDPFGGYAAISTWLEALQNELQYCATKWSDIAPRDFGSPPGIGTITASLEGFEPLVPGDWPRFGIDEGAFRKLVRGNNLYKEPDTAWLSELLANASDATLLRVWAETTEQDRKSLLKPKESVNPIVDLKNKLKAFPIRIEFEHLCVDASAAQSKWRITVRDQGIGITREDLQHIRIIGGSHHNQQRRAMIDETPEYMRPQGTFGVGLQSVFWKTPSLSIITNSLLDGKCWRITLERGREDVDPRTAVNAKYRRAGVYVQRANRNDPDVPKPSGTTVSFEIELSAVPVQLHTTYRVGREVPTHAFDVIIDEHLPFDVGKWLEEVDFQGRSMLCSAQAICGTLASPDSSPDTDEERIYWHFDFDENLHIGFLPLPHDNLELHDYHPELEIRYRGRFVETEITESVLLWTCFDAYFGDPRDFVTVSRDKMTTEGKKEIQQHASLALPRALKAYITRLRRDAAPLRDEATLARCSLWCMLHHHGHDESRSVIDYATIGTDWRKCADLAEAINGDSVDLGVIVQKLQDTGSVVIRTIERTGRDFDPPLPAVPDHYSTFICRKESRSFNEIGYSKFKALRRLLQIQGGHEQLLDAHSEFESSDIVRSVTYRDYLVTTDPHTDPLSNEMFKRRLSQLATEWSMFGVNCVRTLFPCQVRYRNLAITNPRIVGPVSGDLDMVYTDSWMILPFELGTANRKDERTVVSCNTLTQYVTWVAERAKDQSNPERERQKEVALATLTFIDEALPVLGTSNKHQVNVDMAHVRRQLHSWLGEG